MSYEPADLARIKSDFARQRRTLLFWGMGCAVVISVVVGTYLRTGHILIDDNRVALLFLLVWLVGQAVTAVRIWRCPGCKKFLGLALSPGNCPSCSVPLQD